MKKAFGMLAALIGGLTFNAQAQGFFVGEEVGITTYPGFASFVGVASSHAVGIFGGQWLSENWGWEAALTDLGSIESSGTGVTRHKHAVTALSAAGLGGFKLGKGTVFGKVGLYRASVKYAGPTFSATDSTTDFVIGGGYSMSFTEHLVGKAELDYYNNVRFQTVNAPAGTTNSNAINKLSVGLAYTF